MQLHRGDRGHRLVIEAIRKIASAVIARARRPLPVEHPCIDAVARRGNDDEAGHVAASDSRGQLSIERRKRRFAATRLGTGNGVDAGAEKKARSDDDRYNASKHVRSSLVVWRYLIAVNSGCVPSATG
jgi:hypothetical protein